MNAEDMGRITDQTLQRRKREAQDEVKRAEVDRAEAAKEARHLWLCHGIHQFLSSVQAAAQRGESCYEKVMDECPDYVVESLVERGFKVDRTRAKRGSLYWVADDHYERNWAHVLTVRW
jgi:hypothetical protein